MLELEADSKQYSDAGQHHNQSNFEQLIHMSLIAESSLMCNESLLAAATHGTALWPDRNVH